MAYNRMNVFFSQSQAAKQNVQQPQQPNAAVLSTSSTTQAQRDQNQAGLQQTQQLAKDTQAPVLDKSLAKATEAAQQNVQQVGAPTFSQAQGTQNQTVSGFNLVKAARGQPGATFSYNETVPTGSYSDIATSGQNAQQVEAEFLKARQAQDQQAQTFQTEAQKAATEAFQKQNEELARRQQMNVADLAAQSNFQTDREQFLRAATQDPTSNAGLLSQMYVVDPQNMALESQARQGEINQLRSDAARTLTDKEMAEGERNVRNVEGKEEAGRGMTRLSEAFQRKTNKIEKQADEIRNNPNLSDEAKQKAIDGLNKQSDAARDTLIKRQLGHGTHLALDVIRDLAKGGDGGPGLKKIEELYRQGVTPDTLRARFQKEGVPAERIDMLLDAAARQRMSEKFKKAHEVSAAYRKRREEEEGQQIRANVGAVRDGRMRFEDLSEKEQQFLLDQDAKNREYHSNVDNARAYKNAWRRR
jgi:hypothetical protein